MCHKTVQNKWQSSQALDIGRTCNGGNKFKADKGKQEIVMLDLGQVTDPNYQLIEGIW